MNLTIARKALTIACQSVAKSGQIYTHHLGAGKMAILLERMQNDVSHFDVLTCQVDRDGVLTFSGIGQPGMQATIKRAYLSEMGLAPEAPGSKKVTYQVVIGEGKKRMPHSADSRLHALQMAKWSADSMHAPIKIYAMIGEKKIMIRSFRAGQRVS